MPHDSRAHLGGLSHSPSPSWRLPLALVLTLWVAAPSATPANTPQGPGAAAPGPAQEDGSIRDLKSGRPLVREISAGETHVYRLTLAAGQYARVDFEQMGIDVSVALSDTGGTLINKFDNLDGGRAPEHVWLIAESTGDYELRVSPSAGDAKPGRYVDALQHRAGLRADRSAEGAGIF
jgi:hypothetical protein